MPPLLAPGRLPIRCYGCVGVEDCANGGSKLRCQRDYEVCVTIYETSPTWIIHSPGDPPFDGSPRHSEKVVEKGCGKVDEGIVVNDDHCHFDGANRYICYCFFDLCNSENSRSLSEYQNEVESSLLHCYSCNVGAHCSTGGRPIECNRHDNVCSTKYSGRPSWHMYRTKMPTRATVPGMEQVALKQCFNERSIARYTLNNTALTMCCMIGEDLHCLCTANLCNFENSADSLSASMQLRPVVTLTCILSVICTFFYATFLGTY
ncbi:unnamed protein product [Notodromas monacha]|uniref:Uncharacterized protein n=1 Tax=Notodromas monacha TaxID=399045 RepID=A0A7R9BGM9_9CRUS|nr:unnamed protein product [Notodromas monacha]CAG0915105.1 unnamed protein product [Notodromas monacha]